LPTSYLRLLKQSAEFIPRALVNNVPRAKRGLYVLYRRRRIRGVHKFDVVYVGMTCSGIRGRLRCHVKNKVGSWTHFSVFEVWDNVRDDEIAELEGIFRHFYRRDSKANSLNVQRGFKRARQIRRDDFTTWQ